MPTDDLYLLGLLNSKIAFFYFRNRCAALEGSNDVYLEFRAQYVRDFPVRVLDLSRRTDEGFNKQIVELVRKMLALHKQLQTSKNALDKSIVSRQIVAIERQIDQLVYELYGLTSEEIAIVEEASPK